MSVAFNNIHPGMTQEDALKILGTPIENLNLDSDYYMAVAHLINFPGLVTEKALLNIAQNESSNQAVRLARRKAIEVLARLRCVRATSVMKSCLLSEDQYLVENAVWGLQQLCCQDINVHQIMINLLSKNSQNRRVVIQSLASLGVADALAPIESLLDDEQTSVRSAACSAVIQLSGKRALLSSLKRYLASPKSMDRQSVIQDIIDCHGFEILPSVLSTPVSPVFRLRAISALWQDMRDRPIGKFVAIWLDNLFKDDPNCLKLLHRYDSTPCKRFLLEELFQADFSRCYLALRTLSSCDPDNLWPLIVDFWHKRINTDYSAHYFLIQLFRLVRDWRLQHIDMIKNILISSILDQRPQFAKSRPPSILALSQVQPSTSLSFMREWCSEQKMPDWQCRYAALMTLDTHLHHDNNDVLEVVHQCTIDSHPLVSMRARATLQSTT